MNVLRPVVAVDRFVTFAALALHEHSAWAARLAAVTTNGTTNGTDDGTADDLHCFVQEVRRYYPFFPFAVARAEREFTCDGLNIPRGARVLLDLFGTDHDARLWDEPDEFRPERFRHWPGDAFTLIGAVGTI